MSAALRKAYEDRIFDLEKAHRLNSGALSRTREELVKKQEEVDRLANLCALEESELSDLHAALAAQPQPTSYRDGGSK